MLPYKDARMIYEFHLNIDKLYNDDFNSKLIIETTWAGSTILQVPNYDGLADKITAAGYRIIDNSNNKITFSWGNEKRIDDGSRTVFASSMYKLASTAFTKKLTNAQSEVPVKLKELYSEITSNANEGKFTMSKVYNGCGISEIDLIILEMMQDDLVSNGFNVQINGPVLAISWKFLQLSNQN